MAKPNERQRLFNNTPISREKLEALILARKDPPRKRYVKWVSTKGMKRIHYHIRLHRRVWYFLNRRIVLASMKNDELFCFRSFLRWCKELEATLRMRKKYSKEMEYDMLMQLFSAYDWAQKKEKLNNEYSEAIEHATYLELLRDIKKRDRNRKDKAKRYTHKRKKDFGPRAFRDEEFED